MLSYSEIPVPWLAAARVLCVDQAKVYIWEYPNTASRRQVSEGISDDGTYVPPGYLDIHARIDFWGQGRLLILYLGTEQKIIDALTATTDEYLTPDAQPRGPFGAPFDKALAGQSQGC